MLINREVKMDSPRLILALPDAPAHQSPVRIIDASEHQALGLPRFRDLVYAIYTPDQQPRAIRRLSPPHGNLPTEVYVVADLPDTGLTRELPLNLMPYAREFTTYTHLGGFFGIEIARPPAETIEAAAYFDCPEFSEPKGSTIAYLSEFSPHPQLDHHAKRQVLRQLFSRCRDYLVTQAVDTTYIVLAPPIRDFVLKAAPEICLTPLETTPRHTPEVDELRHNNPGYWDTNPSLYEIDLQYLK